MGSFLHANKGIYIKPLRGTSFNTTCPNRYSSATVAIQNTGLAEMTVSHCRDR